MKMARLSIALVAALLALCLAVSTHAAPAPTPAVSLEQLAQQEQPHGVVPATDLDKRSPSYVVSRPSPRIVTRYITITRTITQGSSSPTHVATNAPVVSTPAPTAAPMPAPIPAPAPVPAPAPSTGGSGGISGTDVSHIMLDMVNAARGQFGLTSLALNGQLTNSCTQHAEDMAQHENMSHTGSDGSSPADRATRAGYNWSWIAENVAAGQRTVADVMDAWMHSPGHRANILANKAVDFASAFCQGKSGTIYWVQCFGAPM